MSSQSFVRKLNRKLLKHQHTVTKETGVVCSSTPSKHLVLCNTGQINGLTEAKIIENYNEFGEIDHILLIPGKSCAFLTYNTTKSAISAFEKTNGHLKIAQDDKPILLSYVDSLPNIQDEKIWNIRPPGLEIIENFVSESEETELMALCNFGNETNVNKMKHRQVRHFGYEFRYDINNVNKNKPLSDPIPPQCTELFKKLPLKLSNFEPDQLTVNHYSPGQGIPSHIDTHSAFEDPIMSLSLGSPVVMEFHRKNKTIGVVLPRRSLAIMSGESRYDWAHGITPKTFDFYYNDNECVSFRRETRISFTFRKILQGECKCEFKLSCDSYNKAEKSEISAEIATQLENHHVHDVYEDIAGHFSETRHKPWPNVLNFIHGFEMGAIVVDVGCGNGKYFGHNPNIYQVGTDRSFKLAELCLVRGFETFTGNCLNLPLRDNSTDGVISIAVIHHLSTCERRLKAISEMVRVLRPKGQALVYVWAKEQVKNAEKSTYIKQDRKNRKISKKANAATVDEVSFGGVSLPVHTNRTDFNHSDLLVPWKLKSGDKHAESSTFLRYYHVFGEGELDNLCKSIRNVKIVRSYYDQGNYCIILEKIIHF